MWGNSLIKSDFDFSQYFSQSNGVQGLVRDLLYVAKYQNVHFVPFCDMILLWGLYDVIVPAPYVRRKNLKHAKQHQHLSTVPVITLAC